MKRLRVFCGDMDISDDISLEHGKANPFGWSQQEVHYEGQRIGWIESGRPMDFEEGFTFSVENCE